MWLSKSVMFQVWTPEVERLFYLPRFRRPRLKYLLS